MSSNNEVAAFLFGAAVAIIIRSLISAASRYWLYTRPANKAMREQIRACFSKDVKP